ncbi:hypothetical protein SteCoe_34308 [Stentor coeruleus]|uniref:Uncharacterized protein n=1 Tax=Stentor coeruleus TaxID=5963 RepID=A0A1R2AUT8_9CILI|nr:hypothetical protein SteCoe_34308 [Stentor coeruleus]
MSEESENNLLHIYKSAVASMQNEIDRLNRCLAIQNYQKKLSILEEEKEKLTDTLESMQSHYATPLIKSPHEKHSERTKTPVLVEELITLQAQVIETSQKINRERRKISQECEYLEDNMRQINGSLYILVSKFNEAKRNNIDLRCQLKKLIKERQSLTNNYSKITKALVKESPLNEKMEKIENQERLVREKITSINVLKKMIEQLKIPTPVENPALTNIFNKIKKLEELLKENEKTKRNLKISIEMTQAEIDYKKKNPQKIPPAIANKYYRQELHSIELDIAEKSRTVKELERQRLVAQISYSDALKEKISLEPKKKKAKSVSSCCTYSSLATERNQSRIYTSQDLIRASKKDTQKIVGMIKRSGEPVITKDVLSVLDLYAPGQCLTSKIIAFNRGHAGKLSSKS